MRKNAKNGAAATSGAAGANGPTDARSKKALNGGAPKNAQKHVSVPKMKTTNRPDEWKIEQGLSGAVLPVLDMTKGKTRALAPQVFGPLTKDEKAIKSVGNRDKLFIAEKEGWKG